MNGEQHHTYIHAQLRRLSRQNLAWTVIDISSFPLHPLNHDLHLHPEFISVIEQTVYNSPKYVDQNPSALSSLNYEPIS